MSITFVNSLTLTLSSVFSVIGKIKKSKTLKIIASIFFIKVVIVLAWIFFIIKNM